MRSALLIALLASATGSSATQVLKARDAEIRAALPPAGQAPTEAQREKAEALLTKIVDFRGIAQASLGKTWSKLSPTKQREFVDAFSRRFKQASGEQLDFYRSTAIAYEPEQKEGDIVKVPTSMTVKGEPTHVTYAMKPSKEGWRIEDIVIDDVSTVENYRSSFAKVINKDGIDGLISRLKKTTGGKGETAAKDEAKAGSAK